MQQRDKFLLYMSLLLLAATLVEMLVSLANDDSWEYFAIYSRRPVFVDDAIEFGVLGAPQPYVPGNKYVLGMSGPYSIGRHWPQPPAVSTQWELVWRVAGVQEVRGLLIPPWGWNVPPTYEVKHDEVSIFGSDPKTVIPFRAFRVPLLYVAMFFTLLPIYQLWKYLRWLIFWKPGTCKVCGYDLRATPDRCPECGAMPRKLLHEKQ